MVTAVDLLPKLKQVESGGDPNALSPKGAAGAFQIMPATAAKPGYGVTPLQGWDGQDPRTAPPAEQERFAREYLQAMSALHGGDVKLALASYNAGPGAVQMAGNTVPNYPETQNYVKKITQGADVAATNIAPGNTATDWRTRAQVVTDAAPATSDWRTRAQPVTATSDWRTRAQAVTEPPSTTEDVTKSAASGLAKGVVDGLMVLPNLANEAVAGPQYLYEGLVGQDRKDFQPYKPFFSSSDVTTDSAIDYKPKTTAGKVVNVAAQLGGNIVTPSAVNKVGNKLSPGVRQTAAERKDISQAKYDQVDKSGAVLDDQVFQDFSAKAAQIRPQGRIQKATESVDKFDEALAEVQKVASVKNMTIGEVKQLDERLTNLAEGARGVNGKGTPESRLINQLKHTWRSTVEDAADKGLVTVKSKPNTAFDTADDYVYHTTPKDDFNVDSFTKKGILPSKDGYSGPGAYMANTPDNTLGYTISKLDEGELLRVNKNALIEKFGKYPQNKNGVQFDSSTGEVILPGNRNVPPEFVELKTAGGWKPLSDKPYVTKGVSDPKAVAAWKGAVRDYATANRAKDIELIIERAKLTDNPATAIKTGMRNLYLKIEKGQARGYTKEQTAAIKKAAETGVTTGIARVVGSRLNPIVALSSTGIDAGITAGVASKAARDFASKSQIKRADKVVEMLLGKPVKDPQTVNWAAKNQAAARKASIANMLGASKPKQEKNK